MARGWGGVHKRGRGCARRGSGPRGGGTRACARACRCGPCRRRRRGAAATARRSRGRSRRSPCSPCARRAAGRRRDTSPAAARVARASGVVVVWGREMERKGGGCVWGVWARGCGGRGSGLGREVGEGGAGRRSVAKSSANATERLQGKNALGVAAVTDFTPLSVRWSFPSLLKNKAPHSPCAHVSQ